MATVKKKTKIQKLKAFVLSSAFANIYGLVALAILLSTTVFWAILGAKLQASNADQLANSYLFSNSATFHASTLPGAHTFLIKWPLFMLIGLFSFSGGAFATFTVLLTLVTVMAFALIIYRIERRPLVAGTIFLALGSVLMLVPALPFAGGLLPLNMAMLTTRNIEYIIYIWGLWLIVKSPHLHSWRFWLGAILTCLLVVSDRLFLYFSVGGALLALISYALINNWNLVSVVVRWLIGSTLAAAGAFASLWYLSTSGIVHISNAGSAGPYGLVNSVHGFGLAIVFAILNLFSNFGANGAFDTSILRDVPHAVVTRFFGVSGFSFLTNLAILVFGLVLVYKLMRDSLLQLKNKRPQIDLPSKLALMLIWSTLAAFAVFIFSNHYYAGDGRYLGISLFAVFVTGTVFMSRRAWRTDLLILCGCCFILSILLALPTTFRTYRTDKDTLFKLDNRNSIITQALSHHPVTTLVGDYWRVIPTRYASGNKLNVMPLDSCLQPRQVLSSKNWQPNLNNNGFAYLLTFDHSTNSGYPACDLNKIIKAYGRPNASAVIAGSLSKPQESLLFYDHGIHKSAPKNTPPNKSPATVLPITLDELPYSTCSVPTDVNIVAHQDDDLLFMNPDILNDIRAGYCVRTIYVTAGDSGSGKFYWLSREEGSEAAYSAMLGTHDLWVQRIVKLNNHEYITIANPKGNAKISLIFMHLPDGNLNGQGFPANHFESLQKLEAGKINLIHTIDGQSTFSYSDVVSAMTDMLHFYQPTEIRTQANYISKQNPDHSDHMAVGRYAKKAYQAYEEQQFLNQVTIPIKYYIGYPSHGFPDNVTGTDLAQKEKAFIEYSKYDHAVCHDISQCLSSSTYGLYFSRQYQNPY